MTSREYSNKISKRRAREELSIIFCESDDNDDKKKVLGMLCYLIIILLNLVITNINKYINITKNNNNIKIKHLYLKKYVNVSIKIK